MGKPYCLDLGRRICGYAEPVTLAARPGEFLASVQPQRFRQGREWAENDLFRLGQMSPHETL